MLQEGYGHCGAHVLADKGMGVAVTDSARAVLQELEAAPENKLPSLEEKVAGLEVARMQKEETGARPMPVLGSYGQVTPDVRPPLDHSSESSVWSGDATALFLIPQTRWLMLL